MKDQSASENFDEDRWIRINDRILPEVCRRLELRFNARAFVSPESLIISAVRVYLNKEQNGELFIEADDELSRYLYVVAWRKINQALKKEHFDKRLPLEGLDKTCDAIIASGCEEVSKKFQIFLGSLSHIQRLWLEGRQENTLDQIIANNGWTDKEVERIGKSVQRKAKKFRLREDLGDV